MQTTTSGDPVEVVRPENRPVEWRSVVAFDCRIEVSELGEVRRPASVVVSEARGLVIRGARSYPVVPGSNGYLAVTISTLANRYKRVHVHRLVGEAFLGPRPRGMVTRHLNDQKHDNRAANLCYGSGSDNQRDALRNGRRKTAKLSPDRVRTILASTEPHATLARRFGVTPKTIRRVRLGTIWQGIADAQ